VVEPLLCKCKVPVLKRKEERKGEEGRKEGKERKGKKKGKRWTDLTPSANKKNKVDWE
jgi:hypothetical protein